MIAAEFVREMQTRSTMRSRKPPSGVLDDEVAATGLAAALLHRWNVAAKGGEARVVADLLQRSQNGLM